MTQRLQFVTKSFLHKGWKKAGFQQMTDVQKEAIPLMLERKDLFIESPTGTGKTLAYLIPILEMIDPTIKHAQAVIIAPSRELVMQIHDVTLQWVQGSDITNVSLIGGANIRRQMDRLKRNPQIIVGTPGRVLELIKMRKIKMHEVKTIVLDEADQLLIPEHEKTIEAIIRTTLKERQIVLCSATLPEKVVKIGQKFMQHPSTVRMKALPKTEHVYIVTDRREKPEVVRKLVRGEPMTALLFARDIGNLNVLAQRLQYRGIELSLLHSEATQQERVAALRDFRRGEHSLLLATDVAARGLDIEDITHVIHYDIPRDVTQYVHRSGRTGRMGAAGTVLSIVTRSEEKELKRIARQLGLSLKEKIVYKGKLVAKREAVAKRGRRRPRSSQRYNRKPRR